MLRKKSSIPLDKYRHTERAMSEAQSTTSNEQQVMNIGQLARYLLTHTSKTGAEILAIIKQKFPDAKTGPASIAWYKNDLKKKGILAKTNQKFSAEIDLSEFAE